MVGISNANINLSKQITPVYAARQVIAIVSGTSTASLTVPVTGYKKYLLYCRQIRDAYSMTYTITAGDSNVKEIELLDTTTNNASCIITVEDTTANFSVKGTAYNGDSANSAATILAVVFGLE